MGIGFLKVNVFADNMAQPIDDAVVEVLISKKRGTFKTKESGQTELIEIFCPDKQLSLEPQKKYAPYEVCDVKVSKNNFRPTIIEGVQILDTSETIQNIYLKTSAIEEGNQYLTTPAHKLYANYPAKIIEEQNLSLSNTQYKIPKTIVVHDGLPNNKNSSQYEVSFTDYIKNVACNEIYSTWPIEAIKANVYAILSFTLNRIYSNHYRSKGYNFDITNTSQLDQTFTYGRGYFKEISDIVDQNFDTYIKSSSNVPYLSQINDGVRFNNLKCLSKWESKELASDGYSALEILKYYYGQDKQLERAMVTNNSPINTFKNKLEKGAKGENVKLIQHGINVISGSIFELPKIKNCNGKFDEPTALSIKKFQDIFNMPVTGVVDFSTWHKISDVYDKVMNNYKFSLV